LVLGLEEVGKSQLIESLKYKDEAVNAIERK